MENPEDIEEEKRLEDAMEHLKILHLKVTIPAVPSVSWRLRSSRY